MTIDETKPLGTDLVSTLDDYMREGRVQINLLWEAVGSGGISYPVYTAVNMAVGDTSLVAGTDISASGLEIIALSADVAVNLTTMKLCEAGVIKHIIAVDDDITIINNTASTTGGTFYLNSPTGVNLAMATKDVLTVVNIGGDGSVSHGYWVELNRKLQV